MTERLTLFDLFGSFADAWPKSVVTESPGDTPEWSPADWLGLLNDKVHVKDVRTGADGARAVVEASLWTPDGFPTQPDGFPFALTSTPSVRLFVRNVPESSPVRLFASVSDDGADVLLEGVPLEIRLPSDLLGLHPEDEEDASKGAHGDFSPGKLDSVKVVLGSGSFSSIFAHARLRFTPEGRVVLTTPVPISVGRCRFMGVPCRALHDLVLLPSMKDAHSTYEWVRHETANWLLGDDPVFDGGFGVRSVDLDPGHEPMSKFVAGLGDRIGGSADEADFVLDDLIVPFHSPFTLPVPRHITAGFRRRVLNWADKSEVFSFMDSPLLFRLGGGWAVFFEYLFYQSMSLDPSRGEIDPGLRLKGGVILDADSSQPMAFGLEVGENLTVRISLQRQFGADGEPKKELSLGSLAAHVSAKVATIQIDFMSLKLGLSIGKLVQGHYRFLDSFELLTDVFVFMPPTGDDGGFFRMRSLSGEKIAFLIEDIGWKQGAPSVGGLAMPDGVILYFGPVGLVLQEIALIPERGASYLSFDAGLAIEPPGGVNCGFLLKRLRFRVAGSEAAPAFLLDGVFGWVEWPGGKIEIGGYYTEAMVDATTLKREFGLTGTLALKTGPLQFFVAVDLLVGAIKKLNDDAGSFDYFMGQVFYRGPLAVVYGVEIRNLRLLFARNVLPKLGPHDPEAAELRYLNWYDSANPMNVSGDRRLAAWRPSKDSIAVGAGSGASFAGCGSVFELFIFVLVIAGEDENGFLIVAQLYMLFTPKPIAYAAIEYDIEHGRFSVVVGLSLTLKTFVEEIPDWMEDVGKLTGTLLFSNSPGTVAIGRIQDQRTWLTWSMIPVVPLVGSAGFSVAVCFEWVDGERIGGGLAIRLEGGPDYVVIRFTFHASLGFVYTAFLTTSKDYAAVLYIEVGARATVLFFLQYGISVGVEWRCIGPNPSRSEWTVKLCFETPWFAPDVTFKLQFEQGEVDLDEMGVAASALRSSALVHEPTQSERKASVERLDPAWIGVGPSKTFSLNEVRGGVRAEGTRVAAFEADGEVQPCPTDSTIAVEFTVPVTDALHLEAGMADADPQRSGDLSMRYELTGLRLRRRPRFEPAAAWTPVEEQRALGASFGGSGGVGLDGTFEPVELTRFWDPDVKVNGRRTAKRLLINARTPFTFKTRDDESDEQTIRENPSWPCCGGKRKPGSFPEHVVTFAGERPGANIAGSRTFTASQSRLLPLRPTHARPSLLESAASPRVVACVEVGAPCALFRAELDEEATILRALFAVDNQSALSLWLIAFDGAGEPVGRQPLVAFAGGGLRIATIVGGRPIRSFEIRAEAAAPASGARVNWLAKPRGRATLEVAEVAYVSAREHAGVLVGDAACGGGGEPAWQDRYEGRGKLFFLPNHDYELEVTTTITLSHPGEGETSADLREYVYFRTKGLPGLNASQRVGEEVEAYVRLAYAGGRGTLYRSEPIAVQFDEGFSVALPLSVRSPGSLEERSTLLELALTAEPTQRGAAPVQATATAADWIVAHRQVEAPERRRGVVFGLAENSLELPRARSKDGRIERLARLTQREGSSCSLDDPRDVTTSTLVAMPHGAEDPLDPSGQLWPAGYRFDGVVRPKSAGFIGRQFFDPADKTAFTFALDSAAGGADAWIIDAGVLKTKGPGRRFAVFGDDSPEWAHARVRVALSVQGAAAGIGFGVQASGAGVTCGVFATMEREAGSVRIRIWRREAAGSLQEAASAVIDDPGDQPVEVVATGFDDRVRIEAGGKSIEAERGALRGGRLCLLADGGASFASLMVEGLPMYAFPAQVSRYRDFREHIESFPGAPAELAEDAMGPGVASETVDSLWARTGLAVLDAMRPDAAPAERQRLFDEWTAKLGLPIADEVDRLELSRIVRAGKTRAILLETPERIDFTEETAITLERRVRRSQSPSVDWSLLEALARRLGLTPGGKRPGPTGVGVRRDGAKGLRAAAPAKPSQDVVEVRRQGDKLRLRLRADSESLGDHISLAQIVSGKDGLVEAHVFGMDSQVGISRDGAVFSRDRVISARHVEEDAFVRALDGVVLVIDSRRGALLGGLWVGEQTEWLPMEVVVLQSADSLRALIILVEGGSAAEATPGMHQLRFRLDRPRWITTDPPDGMNSMLQSALLQMHL